MRNRYAVLAVIAVFVACFLPVTARAMSVSEPPVTPPKTASPLMITNYSGSTAELRYVQVFNSSDAVVDMTGWKVAVLGSNGDEVLAVQLNGLIRPGGYVVIAVPDAVANADMQYASGALPVAVASLRLVAPDLYNDHVVTVKFTAAIGYWGRNVSDTTGNYLSTFTAFTPTPDYVLYGLGLYDPPGDPGVEMSELLVNPRTCSPLDIALDCRDYVKLYNPTTTAIDLSQYRLRVGYQGQTPSTSNTFRLSGELAPGHYAVIANSADGRAVAVTNSGGYVWLEDAYGFERYDQTVLEYPDASADSKKGQAWAYDVADGTWKWTAQPTPADAPSVFPVIPVKAAAVTALTPCKEGQYRSEETNRCRNIVAETATLTPCRDGQYRSEETNRCRNIAAASASLVPCKEGQERNPETNRCRNVTTSAPDTAFAVEPFKQTAEAFAGWWALGGVGAIAAGYAGFEWRREAMVAIQKLGGFFASLVSK